jgi:hypothetical protein
MSHKPDDKTRYYVIEERRIIEVKLVPQDKSMKRFYTFLLIALVLGLLFGRC